MGALLGQTAFGSLKRRKDREFGQTFWDSIRCVSHVHGDGSASEIVIDVGGFLGIGTKPVAVAATQLDFMRDEDGDVHAVTTWTKDELEQMPERHD